MASTTRSMAKKSRKRAGTARKMTGTTPKMTVKKSPISLLPFPPEIRTSIYRYCFGGATITFQQGLDDKGPRISKVDIDVALTLTNKATRHDSLPCLYNSTKLHFNLSLHPYCLQGILPTDFLAGVKHVSLDYSSNTGGGTINANDFRSLARLDVRISDGNSAQTQKGNPGKDLKASINQIALGTFYEVMGEQRYERFAQQIGLWNKARSYQINMAASINVFYQYSGMSFLTGGFLMFNMNTRTVSEVGTWYYEYTQLKWMEA